MLYTQRSKCAGCDQRNASVYCPEADDMYCYSCYEQKQIDNECYCTDKNGSVCDYAEMLRQEVEY